MKKKSTAIVWGILLLLAAVGLMFYAFAPDLVAFIPVWKWFVGGAILYWLIKKVVFGKNLAERLSVFLPLALLFMVFEKEIGAWTGKGDDFVNNWILLAAAVLLNMAVYFIFRSTIKKSSSSSAHGTSSTSSGWSKTVEIEDEKGDSEDGNTCTIRKFWLGDHVCYIDADANPEVYVSNKLGSLNVYYQNADVGDLSRPITLNLTNRMGETRIHIPRNWHVELVENNSMGDISCRADGEVTIRTITINVENNMGDVKVVSDD